MPSMVRRPSVIPSATRNAFQQWNPQSQSPQVAPQPNQMGNIFQQMQQRPGHIVAQTGIQPAGYAANTQNPYQMLQSSLTPPGVGSFSAMGALPGAMDSPQSFTAAGQFGQGRMQSAIAQMLPKLLEQNATRYQTTLGDAMTNTLSDLGFAQQQYSNQLALDRQRKNAMFQVLQQILGFAGAPLQFL